LRAASRAARKAAQWVATSVAWRVGRSVEPKVALRAAYLVEHSADPKAVRSVGTRAALMAVH